jgi:hypothetical protein
MTPGYDLYKRLPGLVLGFHGCDESVGKAVINGEHRHLKSSQNSYDWLGTGIYFWENDPLRALEFAEDAVRNKHLTAGKVTKPFVVGAVIDLGLCLNMLERSALKQIRDAHEALSVVMEQLGIPMPQNKGSEMGARYLDRTVMEFFHEERASARNEDPLVAPEYDSVRAMFPEGEALFDGAGFQSKSHIQIAVRNPNCIKGYFRPLL